ncbi:hypothetical protein LX32DRAFT_180793 [Colletotrichum zoysiae]|uniref:Uncharacterized protein n=1 Tax=Colletotrichum zoysiae TaxID=1216348 RepID=A0AAD9HQW2_9PEZI|nr:hypothetical protein LX32DRAFT_180793 [Colletotrichum zoysiae]
MLTMRHGLLSRGPHSLLGGFSCPIDWCRRTGRCIDQSEGEKLTAMKPRESPGVQSVLGRVTNPVKNRKTKRMPGR